VPLAEERSSKIIKLEGGSKKMAETTEVQIVTYELSKLSVNEVPVANECCMPTEEMITTTNAVLVVAENADSASAEPLVEEVVTTPEAVAATEKAAEKQADDTKMVEAVNAEMTTEAVVEPIAQADGEMRADDVVETIP